MSTFANVIQRGLRSAQPAASAVAIGTLYHVTDEHKTERSTGSAWQDYSDTTTGSAGNVTSTAADASKPGSPTAGDLFLPSDGVQIYRSTGSVWAPWGPIFPLTDPSLQTWAWVNQGSATVSTTNGGIYLFGPKGGTTNLRIRKMTAPATPYTMTAGFIPHMIASANLQYAGLLFRSSSGGVVEIGALTSESAQSPGRFYIQTGPSATSITASSLTANLLVAGALFWLRVTDNGTNRIWAWSLDGQHFHQLYSVGRTTTLTADEVGFFVGDTSNVYDVGLTLVSWKVT